MNEAIGYKVEASDDEIGSVKDFLFDDCFWGVRYVVVDTGHWLPGRKVLVSPLAVGEPDWRERSVPVSLTREQVEQSPNILSDQPVSRQKEEELHRFFGWAPYWGPAAYSGVGVPPVAVPMFTKGEEGEEPQGDPSLRSMREVKNYHIHATDDSIGHVHDFIVETGDWGIRYLVVDTRNWLPGKKVLVAPTWIKDIRWADEQVYVDLTRDQIKDSPKFDPSLPVNREYEQRLCDYYGRPGYWL
jgi:hypothetical protein